MPYYNITPHTLYQACMGSSWEWPGGDDSVTRARAWVEAEMVYDGWKLVQEYFNIMEGRRKPSPMMIAAAADVPEEVVRVALELLDGDFEFERSRLQGRLPPDFWRLLQNMPVAKAFIFEMDAVLMTPEEIRQQAIKRLDMGERMPP